MSIGGVARRSRRLLYPLFVLALLAAVTAVAVANPFFLRSIRLLAFDSLQRLAPAAYDPGQPVRVVDIDDESLAELGQWPWPRTVVAKLLERIGADGAAAIVIDIMFTEPDRTSLSRYTKDLPPDKAATVAGLIGGPLDNDTVFAAAIARLPVVLGAVLVNGPEAAKPVRKSGFAIAGDDPRPLLHGFSGVLANLPALDAAASGIGATNWIPDDDGVIRRAPLIFRAADQYMPSLAAEALRVAQGAKTDLLKSSNASGETAYGAKTGLNHIKVGDVEAPTDADGAVWPHFRHYDRRAYIPAWHVMSGGVGDALNGRIVLVGASAPGLGDLISTPLDQAIPGVDIHMQMLEQLLTGGRLTRPDFAPALELLVTLALSALIAALLPRLPAAYSSGLAVILVAAIFGFSWYAFTRQSLLFDPVSPSIGIFAVTAACIAWVYRRTQHQRSEIRRAFGQYLSPDVVQQLILHPEKLTLGGEQRPLTIMFCDVRNFTAISEALDAQALTRFINTLLTALTGAILERRGTVDKYMGDAIMAFWNAPLPDDAHAAHAAAAAVEMAGAMRGLNAAWQAEAAAEGRVHREVRIGIGLNTGMACVGNLGSDQRFDYSCIGDEVNIASRFEGLTKQYGVTVAIGERTARQLPGMPVLELDLVRVKGRAAPSRLFTLAETLAIPEGKQDALLAIHAEFLALYRGQAWGAAEAKLAEARAIGAPDLATLHRIYEERIAGHRAEPPGPDWDGAYTAMEK